MNWQQRQYDTSQGKYHKVFRGEKDWTREQKEQIKDYQDKYERGTDERRKSG